ncbi:MAG: hypothetical protein U0796_12450 [Gemmatales bacterium]
MLLRSRQSAPRRGIILLVVLALITLFASIGVAFVYFSEQETSKVQDQKAGETVKLPDPDLLFNFVMQQVIYPTGNLTSSLVTHSLMENLYGRNGVLQFNGTGRLPGLILNAATSQFTGMDQYYYLNYAGRAFNEQQQGSLNPTYTYPDHKNAFLGAVAGNWRQPNAPTYTSHGPVALARSFAREIKFRVPVINTTTSAFIRYHDVILNPYSNFVFPSGVRHSDFWLARTVGPALAPLVIGNLPAPGANEAYAPAADSVITCAANGSGAQIIMDRAINALMDKQAFSLRPTPFRGSAGQIVNANFPPPGDLGGDVKNLPPEVKTLVGFDAANNPVFANNDSYWMDIGFPTLPYSTNKRIKAMAAIFIKDNDGNVNLQVAGNLRGKTGATASTFHTSAHGMHPSEINPRRVGLSSGTSMTATDLQSLKAGNNNPAQVGYNVIRGTGGYSPDQDPVANAQGVAPSAPTGYLPILRPAPFYSLYNFDGSTEAGIYAYNPSNPWLLTGDAALPATTPTFGRFPIYAYTAGFNSGAPQEWVRATGFAAPFNAFNCSSLFWSPYAPTSVLANTDSQAANGAINAQQRTFGIENQQALYRASDAGADKINSDVRRLAPSAFLTPQQRWQMTMWSSDSSVRGIAPWYNETTGDFALPTAAGAYPVPTGTSRGLPPGMPIPPAAVTEFSGNTNYNWRSIFGSKNRIDLARQLPDYPPPPPNAGGNPDPTQALQIANPVVLAQYKIALQARQKMAMEILNNLIAITHPQPDANPNNPINLRWLTQLAVNIVDYIDNDDYSTWLTVHDGGPSDPTPSADKVVWGTELPRLLINEVYLEAVNNQADAMNTQATTDYDINHWVELYNPLEDAGFGPWVDGANARFTVGGTPVYRLIITPHTNATNLRNFNNTMGYPNDTANNKTNVIPLNTADVVAPSGNNYGNGTTNVAGPYANPGFYMVGPTDAVNPMNPQAPDGATTGAVMPDNPLNFPSQQYSAAGMRVTERLSHTSPLTDSRTTRQTILLQRLANPYLPHNPVPPTPAGTTVLFGAEATNPGTPFNPYITIDYVDNLRFQDAVAKDNNGMRMPTPVDQRKSVGKQQPYSAINHVTYTGNNPAEDTTPIESTWQEQRPNRLITNTAPLTPLQNQPQHTFLRHNAVEANYPTTVPPAPPVNPGYFSPIAAPYNTLKTPFDWLVHLDRPPVSPAELLHVSAFKPHELTQQFNRWATVTVNLPPTAPITVPPSVTLTPGLRTYPGAGVGSFLGSYNGIPWKLKVNDVVRIVYTQYPVAAPPVTWAESVVVTNVAADYSSFQCNSTANGNYLAAVQVQILVPFAHYAPWYKAGVSTLNPAAASTSRIYRLLESTAVRNPGIDAGQYRFTSGVNAFGNSNTVNNVGPLLADGSRWIQLDNVATATGDALPALQNNVQITTNGALVKLTSDASLLLPANLNANPTSTDGDLVVLRGTNFERRALVLDIDRVNNRIRTVIYEEPAAATIPPAGGTLPMTIDYPFIGGRQIGKMNLNSIWDFDSFRALVDPQTINSFTGPAAYPEQLTDRVFRRLNQQRQPAYYTATPTLIGSTGVNGVGADRPLQGMGTGDILGNQTIPTQGIGNTLLSDRYQEAGGVPPLAGAPGDTGDDTYDRLLRTLFEVGNPGEDHPYRRFEMLSKLWNNHTVRSNTFSVWITIGFFEWDEINGFGAEVGQIQGKNVRHRFFAVVDRTTIDHWMQAWSIHDNTASVALFSNKSLFPSLDPRTETYPSGAVISLNRDNVYPPTGVLYNRDNGSVTNMPGNTAYLPGIWQVNIDPNTVAPNPVTFPFATDTSVGRLVIVQSNAGTEVGEIIQQDTAASPPFIRLRLTLNHNGILTVRPLPLPPTVLHWSQLK